MVILNPSSIASATREFDLEIYRLQSFTIPGKLRQFVETEHEFSTLLQILKREDLLLIPFRRKPARESRFRARHSPGVFYGAQRLETAMVEIAYHQHRLLKSNESLEIVTRSLVSFSAHLKAMLLDVELLPDNSEIYSRTSYRASQQLALEAREQGIAGIHFHSVRAKEPSSSFAVFDSSALTAKGNPPEPWLLTLTRSRIEFRSPLGLHEFEPAAWS